MSYANRIPSRLVLVLLVLTSILAVTAVFAGSAAADDPEYATGAVHYNNTTTANWSIEVPIRDGSLDTQSITEGNVTVFDDGDDVSGSVDFSASREQSSSGRIVLNTTEPIPSNDLEVRFDDGLPEDTLPVAYAAESYEIGAIPDTDTFQGTVVAFFTADGSEVSEFEITGSDDDNDYFAVYGTGTNSSVLYLDTGDVDTGEYDLDGRATLTVNNLGLSIFADELEVTSDDDIAGTVESRAVDRDVRVVLVDSDGDVVESDEGTLNGQREYDFSFDAADLSAGRYTVQATDEDSGITVESSTVSVDEAADVDASFSRDIYSQTAGDVVEMTVELENADEAYVQLGDEESGFVDVLYIEDDDNDQDVTFEVNTRTLGTSVGSVDSVYNSEDDIVESEVHGGISTGTAPTYEDSDGNPLTASGSAADGSFEAYLDTLDLINNGTGENADDQLVRPLQPTTYDVAANGNNVFVSNVNDEAELDNDIGLAILDLTRPGVEDVRIWTAPTDNADTTDEHQEVVDAVSRDDEIAEGDRLVIQAEATGIYGALVAISGDDFDALDDGISANELGTLVDTRTGDIWNGEGVSLTVESDDAGNQQVTSLNLNGDSVDNQDIFVLLDNEEGQMFIVIDTSSSEAFDNEVGADTEFVANLEYTTDDSERFEFSNGLQGSAGGDDADTGDPAFPYFQADSDQNQSADFTIAAESVSFDNQNADREVQLEHSGGTTVSGSTNLAPGTEASIRIRSDSSVSPSFVKTISTEVADDGSFSGTFDFSSQSAGDTADVSLRVGGNVIDESADGRVVDAVSTETAATPKPDTDTPEPDTETEIPEPDTETETSEPGTATEGPTDEPTSTPTSTPGFGVIVALTALSAAALLAVRRGN